MRTHISNRPKAIALSYKSLNPPRASVDGSGKGTEACVLEPIFRLDSWEERRRDDLDTQLLSRQLEMVVVFDRNPARPYLAWKAEKGELSKRNREDMEVCQRKGKKYQ